MRWLKNIFNPLFWVPWTALGRGFRYGLRGKPADSDYREVAIHDYPTDSLSSNKKEFKLSFPEAEELDITEEKISKLCQTWENKRHPLEAGAEAIQNELSDIYTEYKKLCDMHAEKKYLIPRGLIKKWSYIISLYFICAPSEYLFAIESLKILRLENRHIYGIALGPTIMNLLLASLLGKTLRLVEMGKSSPILKFIILPMNILGGIGLTIALAYLRLKWVQHTKGMADFGLSLTWLCIGLTLFIGPAVASYFKHCDDLDLEQIWSDKKEYLERLKKNITRWIKKAALHDKIRGVTIQKIQRFKDNWSARVDEFRSGVTLGRSDNHVPPWFNDPVTDAFFMPRDLGERLTPKPEYMKALREIKELGLVRGKSFEFLNNILKEEKAGSIKDNGGDKHDN